MNDERFAEARDWLKAIAHDSRCSTVHTLFETADALFVVVELHAKNGRCALDERFKRALDFFSAVACAGVVVSSYVQFVLNEHPSVFLIASCSFGEVGTTSVLLGERSPLPISKRAGCTIALVRPMDYAELRDKYDVPSESAPRPVAARRAPPSPPLRPDSPVTFVDMLCSNNGGGRVMMEFLERVWPGSASPRAPRVIALCAISKAYTTYARWGFQRTIDFETLFPLFERTRREAASTPPHDPPFVYEFDGDNPDCFDTRKNNIHASLMLRRLRAFQSDDDQEYFMAKIVADSGGKRKATDDWARSLRPRTDESKGPNAV